ncbi:MAG: NTP transferase domain-containing protein [Bacteroidetes bacterium]|nr:NTP transferase domain-containing protein [Bacteroidota bacterium]
MKTDKAMLNYNGIAQQYYTYKLLEKVCNKVYISCNEAQKDNIDENFNIIIDNNGFLGAGPMTGLLSFANKFSGQAVLIAGCDYPHLRLTDLKYLLKNRSEKYETICYYNTKTNIDEPLISVFETSSLKKLFEYYSNGNYSLRHFLATCNTKRLKPLSAKAIESVDTIEKAEDVMKNIKKY